MKTLKPWALSIAFLAIAGSIFGQAPKTLTYSGTLSDGGGPLTGSYDLTFKIYDVASGGTALWAETSLDVAVSGGAVSLVLGKITPINIQTVTPMWLGITVESNPEISPRVELSGSLYAIGLALPYEGTSADNVPAIKITKTGMSNVAAFQIDNPVNVSSAVSGTTNGTGTAGLFITTGSGAGVAGVTSGTGAAGDFANYSSSNAAPALKSQTYGTGSAASFSIPNASSTAAVLNITHSGTGNAITANRAIQATQFIGDGSLLTGIAGGGLALPYSATSTASSPAFEVISTGSGTAGRFAIQNESSGAPALYATSNGVGNVASFFANGAPGSNTLSATQAGGGYNVQFGVSNNLNPYPSLVVSTNGTGRAGVFEIHNATSTNPVIEINHQGTGNAITANRPIQATQFIGDGSLLTNLPSAALTLPFSQATSAAGDAFTITNNGTSGTAGTFVNSNVGAQGGTLVVSNAGELGEGLRAYSSGGPAGRFQYNNSTSPYDALIATSDGLGPVTTLVQSNTGNNAPALQIVHSGTGNAITANRPIQASSFIGDGSGLTNITAPPLSLPYYASLGSSSALFDITNSGDGMAGLFRISNASSSASALSVSSDAQAPAFSAASEGAAGFNPAGNFMINHASNGNPAVQGSTVGAGPAGVFFVNNPSGAGSALMASTNGTGSAGWFSSANGTVIQAVTDGTGSGLDVSLLNPGSDTDAINIYHLGTGNAITANRPIQATQFIGDGSLLTGITGGGLTLPYSASVSSSSAALEITNTGSSYAAQFAINNPSSGAHAVYATSNGEGNAGSFFSSGPPGSGALSALQGGGGFNAEFNTSNPSNIYPALRAVTSGTGRAGMFEVLNASNSQPAVQINHSGIGSALELRHDGSSGDIAVFKSGGSAKARVDKDGVGYFNGGTQSSGADVAEMFDVEGERSSYEPGDVLVISESSDRTVEKSSAPNSTKIAGVYATKPGVVLTERGVQDNLDDLVPMGIVGVIPTKVCNEGGPIRRGDLLVTSSVSGHAMKAIPAVVNGVQIYPSGAILGKALENFDGDNGLINVLVSVK